MDKFLRKHWESLLCYGLCILLLAGGVLAYLKLFA